MAEYRSKDFGDNDSWHFMEQCPDYPATDYPYHWLQVWPPTNICKKCLEIEEKSKTP